MVSTKPLEHNKSFSNLLKILKTNYLKGVDFLQTTFGKGINWIQKFGGSPSIIEKVTIRVMRVKNNIFHRKFDKDLKI